MPKFHTFVANGKYCVVSNTYVALDTTVYTDNGSFELHLDAKDIRWYNLQRTRFGALNQYHQLLP